jgi:hypothetical protein
MRPHSLSLLRGFIEPASLLTFGVLVTLIVATTLGINVFTTQDRPTEYRSEAYSTCAEVSVANCNSVPGCSVQSRNEPCTLANCSTYPNHCTYVAAQTDSCTQFTSQSACTPSGCRWEAITANCTTSTCSQSGCSCTPTYATCLSQGCPNRSECTPTTSACTLSVCFAYPGYCTYRSNYCTGPAGCAGLPQSSCTGYCSWVPNSCTGSYPSGCTGSIQTGTIASGQYVTGYRCNGTFTSAAAYCRGSYPVSYCGGTPYTPTPVRSPTPLRTPTPIKTPTPALRSNGQLCSQDSQCLSGYCARDADNTYACATRPSPTPLRTPTPIRTPTPVLRANGQLCSQDSQCLSGYCGWDADGSRACATRPSPTPGATCYSPGSACTRQGIHACSVNGLPGTQTCTFTRCTTTSPFDCSLSPTNCTTCNIVPTITPIRSPTPYRTPTPRPPTPTPIPCNGTCYPQGEPCAQLGTGACPAYRFCCALLPTPTNRPIPTRTPTPLSTQTLRSNGQLCSQDSQCLSGYCAWDADGSRACATRPTPTPGSTCSYPSAACSRRSLQTCTVNGVPGTQTCTFTRCNNISPFECSQNPTNCTACSVVPTTAPTPYCLPQLQISCATGCTPTSTGGVCTSPTPTPYCRPQLQLSCATGCTPTSSGGVCTTPTPTPYCYPHLFLSCANGCTPTSSGGECAATTAQAMECVHGVRRCCSDSNSRSGTQSCSQGRWSGCLSCAAGYSCSQDTNACNPPIFDTTATATVTTPTRYSVATTTVDGSAQTGCVSNPMGSFTSLSDCQASISQLALSTTYIPGQTTSCATLTGPDRTVCFAAIEAEHQQDYETTRNTALTLTVAAPLSYYAIPAAGSALATTWSTATLGGTVGTAQAIANLSTASYITATTALSTLPSWVTTTAAVAGAIADPASYAYYQYQCNQGNQLACSLATDIAITNMAAFTTYAWLNVPTTAQAGSLIDNISNFDSNLNRQIANSFNQPTTLAEDEAIRNLFFLNQLREIDYQSLPKYTGNLGYVVFPDQYPQVAIKVGKYNDIPGEALVLETFSPINNLLPKYYGQLTENTYAMERILDPVELWHTNTVRSIGISEEQITTAVDQYRQLFSQGFTAADLNYRNILIQPDGTIRLIDPSSRTDFKIFPESVINKEVQFFEDILRYNIQGLGEDPYKVLFQNIDKGIYD